MTSSKHCSVGFEIPLIIIFVRNADEALPLWSVTPVLTPLSLHLPWGDSEVSHREWSSTVTVLVISPKLVSI